MGLTLNAQKILSIYGQIEGRKTGSTFLYPEHIILAIIKNEIGKAFNILKTFHLNLANLQFNLENNISSEDSKEIEGDIPPSHRLKTLVDIAATEAQILHSNNIGTEHLLLASIREEKSVMNLFFKGALISVEQLRAFILKTYVSQPELSMIGQKNIGTTNGTEKNSSKSQSSLLKEFSKDITACAKEEKLDAVVGREKELQRVIQILARRTKNNPILIGEPGVGKTAIVEGLAQRIVSENVPRVLLNKKVLTLDLGAVIAGTKYRGEFEERLKTIMKEIRENKNIILFIDELHTLIGAGGSEGTLDAANMLKPALSRGELQCIGATTLKEYRKYFEKDGALERRFQTVNVKEPTDEETEKILLGIKKRYEEYHGVYYSNDIIKLIVKLSRRYINERFMPDKAIDILDEVGAMKKIDEDPRPSELADLEKQIEVLTEKKQKLVHNQDYEGAAYIRDEVRELRKRFDSISDYWHKNPESSRINISENDVCNVVSLITQIPLEQLDEGETNRLIKMEDELHKTVIGQDDAINVIASAIRRSRAGVSSVKRPLGSFMFLGPTGVGKTLLAKTLAKFLFGTEDSLIRIDMSDFMEKHNASKLVGAPPGYVGYDDGGLLTEKVRRNPYSVVLLDEIEKAHKDVFNLLLQVLEEGELRDSTGHNINFKNTVIIMTSNAGARQITNDSKVGFNNFESQMMGYEEIKASALNELKKIMNPELLNRIDDIIVFSALTKNEISSILDLQINELSLRLAEQNLSIKLKKQAREYLIEKGYNPAFGARPMRRLIQKEIEDVLALKIIEGNCPKFSAVIVDCKNDKLTIKIKSQKESENPDKSNHLISSDGMLINYENK